MTVPRIRQAPRYRVDWLSVALWGFGPSVSLTVIALAVWRFL